MNFQLIKTDLAISLESKNPNINFQPSQGTPGSNGLDLRACIPGQVTIKPMQCVTIPCGFKLHLEASYATMTLAGIILPRSGLGSRDGIILGNSAGLIDSDYQDEWKVPIWNRNLDTSVVIKPGMKIAQVVLILTLTEVSFTEVEYFDVVTKRQGGFGHTGDF